MTYHLNGCVRDYDTEGGGTCLTTVLVAYALDCRRAAQSHQERATWLLVEADCADRAATAAAYLPGEIEP